METTFTEKLEKIKNMSFEVAIKELETLVKKLETGNVELNYAVSAYEYGNSLRKHCDDLLASAKLKVEKITGEVNGMVETEEFAIAVDK